jgi:hypothetical protein
MSVQDIQLKIRINFPVVFFTVLFVHLLLMLSKGLPTFSLSTFLPNNPPSTLKIRRVKTAKSEHPKIQTSNSIIEAGAPQKKEQVSFKDLSLGMNHTLPLKTNSSGASSRPGTRPEVTPVKSIKEINAISLKSKEFKNLSKSFPSGGLAISDMISSSQKINDAIVSIEVPEGVEPDQLNEYELMFYGFQKRVAINYVNSIIRNLNTFQKTHPHYRVPSNSKITMTARITYDSEGNIMQIKMIKWTKLNEIQDLFEDIVKGIDQLHNPPKALWEKNNEFSMYYTLEILNG